jgi:hypothetical protein
LFEGNAVNAALCYLLPYYTSHQVLGTGPSASVLRADEATKFVPRRGVLEPMLFGEPVASWGLAELKKKIELYNVRYVIAVSLHARSRLDRYPELFRPAGAFDPPEGDPYNKNESTFRLYEVLGIESSYFLQGHGVVAAKRDLLSITQASSGRIVLKYHWIPTLRASDGINLSAFQVPGASAPFIAIDNSIGANQIEIRNEP